MYRGSNDGFAETGSSRKRKGRDDFRKVWHADEPIQNARKNRDGSLKSASKEASVRISSWKIEKESLNFEATN